MKMYIHGVRHNFRVGQKVKVIPEAWRERNSYIGKIKEITIFGGLYIGKMLGKKNASRTETYYSHTEVENI